MKIALGISVVVNIILTWLVFTKTPEKEVVERVIIETHGENKNRQVPTPPKPAVQNSSRPKKENASPAKIEGDITPMLFSLDDHDVQNAGEKMELERQEFMSRELGMSEEKIAAHNQIRDEYYKRMAKYWEKNPMQELSFKERRKMIDMEEELHSKLEKLHGKENWQRYLKFRQNYNEKGFQKQVEENQPFLFMGL